MTILNWLRRHPFVLLGAFLFGVFWMTAIGDLPMRGVWRVLMAPAYVVWIVASFLAGAVLPLSMFAPWGGDVLIPLAVYLSLFWCVDALVARVKRGIVPSAR